MTHKDLQLADVIIRPATKQDTASIVALVKGILLEYQLEFDPETSEADLNDIDATYFKSGGAFNVVEDRHGKLLGTFGVLPVDQTTCKLRKMYLAPEARGIGLGRHMLAQAIADARRMNYQTMVLETVGVMREAIRLYTRAGFRPVERAALSPRCDLSYSLDLTQKQ